MNIGTLWVTLAADMSQLDKMTTGLNTMSQRFRTFGYLASTALTLPIVAAGKASFQLAKDFEFSMQKVVGLTGESQVSVNNLSKEILALSPSISKGPKELADALYFITSSAFRGEKAMEVLTLSAKAATAGLGETKEISMFLTSALNAYAGTDLTAAKATDILIAAVRESKVEATSFTSSIGQIIPIASQLGVSLAEVAGGMATITLTGSTASQAAVYLKGIFNSLLKATPAGEKALNAVGTSYSNLRKILAEQGLIVLMQKLRDIQVKYGDEIISDVLPNIRALTGFLSIAGKNFEYNSEAIKRVANSSGSLGVAFAAVSNTIKVRLDRSVAQLQVSLISLGKSVAVTVLPILEQWVLKLDKIVKHFDSLTESQRRHKVEFLMWVAVLGPASLIISVLGYAISGLISIIKVASGAFLAFRAAVLITQPWLLAATAILAVADALMVLALNAKKAKDLQTALTDIWDSMYGMRTEGATSSASIESRMGLMGQMDRSQLEKLQNDINTRIQLERDLNIQLLGIKKEGIRDDRWVLDQRKKIDDLQTKLEYKRNFIKVLSSQGKDASILSGQAWDLEETIHMDNNELNNYKAGLQDNLNYQIESMPRIIKLWEGYGSKVGGVLDHISSGANKAAQSIQTALEKIAGFEGKKGFAFPGTEETLSHQAWKILGADMTKPGGSLYGGQFSMGNGTDWNGQKSAIDSYNKQLENQGKIVDELTKSFKKFFFETGGGMKSMMNAMLNGLKTIAAEIISKAAIYLLLQAILPGSDLAVGALTNLRKFIGVKGYAGGTNNASGGWSILGENGPELVNLPGGSKVLPTGLSNIALQPSIVSGEVRFVIEENHLVGILKKANIRKSLY